MKAAIVALLLAATAAAADLPHAFGVDADVRRAVVRDQLAQGAQPERICEVMEALLDESCLVRRADDGAVDLIITKGEYPFVSLLQIIRITAPTTQQS